MLTALTNATVFTGTEEITGKAVLVENNRIKAVIDCGSIPLGAETIDCNNNFVAPGFIDLQIAGGGGYLFSDNPSAEALSAITDSLIKSGTTGFLIVIPTNSFDVYRQVIKTIKANPHPAVLGLHLEGPYINPARRGAHNSDYIKNPDKEEISDLLEEADGVIKMITLAPEVCDQEFVGLLKDRGIVVAAGHSNATFREAVEGFKWGIQSTTHLFNAMSPFHHRDPGLPGATFETENVHAGIIADGIHVDYNVLSVAKKIMNERLYLVSDAVEENLDGTYSHVRHKDRFTLPDGTLSGSQLSMLKAVKNCVENVDIPLNEAIRMASTYPARLIKASDKGEIASGKKADIIVFNKDFEVVRVMVDGTFGT